MRVVLILLVSALVLVSFQTVGCGGDEFVAQGGFGGEPNAGGSAGGDSGGGAPDGAAGAEAFSGSGGLGGTSGAGGNSGASGSVEVGGAAGVSGTPGASGSGASTGSGGTHPGEDGGMDSPYCQATTDPTKFGFIEILSNDLPVAIEGWVEASCAGQFNYVCAFGYNRTSCEQEPQGTHDGCSACLVAHVTCRCP